MINKKTEEKRFGWEWEKYNKIFPEQEVQFLKWLGPLNKDFINNKKILDAGCGMGRNSYWCIKYGAKSVTALDYDKKSVEAAKELLCEFNNVSVKEKNILDINYKNEFNFVFSLGVIHHIKNPKLAIKNLIRALKPEGKLLIWVYGYENNEWILKYINPIRKNVTSKMPLSITHKLSYVFTIPLFLYLKIFPQNSEYLKQISKFRFFHIHSIVFDQFLPVTAKYYKKEELKNLFSKFKEIKNLEFYHVNKNSWSITAEKI